MDIPKNGSYKRIVWTISIVLAASINSLAQQKPPTAALVDSYTQSEELTPQLAEKTIADLKQALAVCTEEILKFRIDYRIGMIYFKAGDFSQAVASFEKLAQSAGCPDMLRLCSLNMAGQIYRMKAQDDQAIRSFEELVDLSRKFLSADPNRPIPVSVFTLAVTAAFAQAEIYQYNQDYEHAIAAYEQIPDFLAAVKAAEIRMYAPLAEDKLSQLYLIIGKVTDYYQSAQNLSKRYPDYYRSALVQLETQAVRLLREKDASVPFPRGSFDAPARLITLCKDSGDQEFQDRTTVLFKDLSSQYQHGYAGLLVGYHYAWLMDAGGAHRQAAELLAAICEQAKSMEPDGPAAAVVIRTLTDYAQLQRAIILGEDSQYKQALEITDALKPDPNDAHLSRLADAIEQGLQTLKREVPTDVSHP